MAMAARIEMAAVAEVISDESKMAAYERNVARLPKRDRRDLSSASPQTKWVMAAMSEWYTHYHVILTALGLPSENWICRLWEPRSKHMNSTPRLPQPSKLAADVEISLTHIRPSRVRVLLVCEQFADRGLIYAAHRLRMSPNATSKYLEEGRQSVADILRSMGWPVPQKD